MLVTCSTEFIEDVDKVMNQRDAHRIRLDDGDLSLNVRRAIEQNEKDIDNLSKTRYSAFN